MDVWQT